MNRSDPANDPQYGRSEAVACTHCGVAIENYRGRWVDAGSNDLVFCTDQDETHDGIRHEPVHTIDCDLDDDCSCGVND